METKRSKKDRGNELLCRLSGFPGAGFAAFAPIPGARANHYLFCYKIIGAIISKENA